VTGVVLGCISLLKTRPLFRNHFSLSVRLNAPSSSHSSGVPKAPASNDSSISPSLQRFPSDKHRHGEPGTISSVICLLSSFYFIIPLGSQKQPGPPALCLARLNSRLPPARGDGGSCQVMSLSHATTGLPLAAKLRPRCACAGEQKPSACPSSSSYVSVEICSHRL